MAPALLAALGAEEQLRVVCLGVRDVGLTLHLGAQWLEGVSIGEQRRARHLQELCVAPPGQQPELRATPAVTGACSEAGGESHRERHRQLLEMPRPA